MSSMNTFLTIAEACEKTSRSASTIRRLIKSIADDDTHVDRAAIEPTPKEVAAFKKKGENFTWRIREDIVMREFTAAPKHEKKSAAEPKESITKAKVKSSRLNTAAIKNIGRPKLEKK